MKIALSVSRVAIHNKADGEPITRFESEPTALELDDDNVHLKEVLTQQVHSAWQYSGKRSVKNTTALLCVPIDFDDGMLSLDQAAARFGEFAGVVYPSTRWTAEYPKVRVLLTLPEPISDIAAFPAICAYLKTQYPDADPEVFKVSQPLFPCCQFYKDDSGRDVPSTAHANFEMRILRGQPYAFPAEVLRGSGQQLKTDTSESGGDDEDERFLENRKEELTQLLLVPEIKGKRERRALVIASHSRRNGSSPEQTLALLQEWNRGNKPPLTDEEMTRVMASDAKEQYRFGKNEPAVAAAIAEIRKVQPWPGTTEEPSPEPARCELNDLQADVEIDDFHIFTAHNLQRIVDFFTPPELVCEFLVYKGTHTVVSAEHGAGKSTMARSLSIGAARNNKRVLWVSAEEEPKPAWWWTRMGIQASDPVYVIDTRLYSGHARQGEERWRLLGKIIKQLKPNIVVFDTLYSLLCWLERTRPDKGDPDQWMPLVKQVGSLGTSCGAGVLTLHHNNRSGTYSGSAGIGNGCDEFYNFKKVGGSVNRRLFEKVKSRYGNESFSVETDGRPPFKYRLTGKIPIELQYLTLCELFRKHGSLTYEQIRTEGGIPRQSAERYLKRLGAKAVGRANRQWTLAETVIAGVLDEGQMPDMVGSATKIMNQ